MPIASRKAKRRRKVRYKTIKLKLSERQKNSLYNYCRARKTTPTKLIKKMIRPYISQYEKEVPEELYVTENQLDMFEE
jgi:hypothetical protein